MSWYSGHQQAILHLLSALLLLSIHWQSSLSQSTCTTQISGRLCGLYLILLHCLCLFIHLILSFKHFRIYDLNYLLNVQWTHTDEDYHYSYVHLVLQTTLLVFRSLILTICMYFLQFISCLKRAQGPSLPTFDWFLHLCCKVWVICSFYISFMCLLLCWWKLSYTSQEKNMMLQYNISQ
jgi:hypothetical protein